MSKSQDQGHALVIGGGIAGLLAAHVLTNHFARVTLIERDRYADTPAAFRPGTPQGRQVHTMLLRGQRVLESLFPGLETKLFAQGAIKRAYGHESLYYYGGRCPKLPPVLLGWNCSRQLLEWQIRQELTTCARLQLMEGVEVLHLLFAKAEHAVCGVQVRERNQQTPTNEVQDVQADLVIDASGSSSPIVTWLEELGYEPPREEIVNANLGYATRFYEPPTHSQLPWRGIAINAAPPTQRGGVLMEIESNRWMTVLSGMDKDYPPTEDEGYLAFARSLPDPSLAEAIAMATPISPIYGYRRTENRRRYFEHLRCLPEGLLVMGDAVCTFNPVYGQGMTVAALEAQVLDTCLQRNQKGFALDFQKKVARVIDFPWKLATASDGRVVNRRQSRGLQVRYVESMMALLPHDPQVLLTFLEVTHMLRPARALMSPMMLTKVVRQQYMRKKKGRRYSQK